VRKKCHVFFEWPLRQFKTMVQWRNGFFSSFTIKLKNWFSVQGSPPPTFSWDQTKVSKGNLSNNFRTTIFKLQVFKYNCTTTTLKNYKLTITILQLWFNNYNYNFITTILNFDFKTTILQLQFYNYHFTTTILQLQFYNHDFIITIIYLMLCKHKLKIQL
jgi:hypothetical protein